MLKDALQFMATQARDAHGATIHHIHGDTFVEVGGQFNRVMPKAVHPEGLSVKGLESLLLFLKAERGVWDDSGLFLHIVGPTRVDIRGGLNEADKSRPTYGYAAYDAPKIGAINEKNHAVFGIPQRDFVSQLSALFVDSGDRALVLKIAGRIVRDSNVETVEDGHNQRVEISKGLSIKDQQEVPNPVTLSPLVTFPEVGQPDRKFVFRFDDRAITDGTPAMGLFPADGNAWETKAVDLIRAHLKARMGELAIYDVPVV